MTTDLLHASPKPEYAATENGADECVQSANGASQYLRQKWITAAYFQLAECGCPADLWPEPLIKLHVGVV